MCVYIYIYIHIYIYIYTYTHIRIIVELKVRSLSQALLRLSSVNASPRSTPSSMVGSSLQLGRGQLWCRLFSEDERTPTNVAKLRRRASFRERQTRCAKIQGSEVAWGCPTRRRLHRVTQKEAFPFASCSRNDNNYNNKHTTTTTTTTNNNNNNNNKLIMIIIIIRWRPSRPGIFCPALNAASGTHSRRRSTFLEQALGIYIYIYICVLHVYMYIYIYIIYIYIYTHCLTKRPEDGS